jgi:transposase
MRGRPLQIAWADEEATLRQLYRAEKDAEVRPRLHALWLLRSGHSLGEVAQLVGVHYVTVQGWIAWYRAGGVAEVRRHKRAGRQGRASLLAPEQLQALRAQADEGTFRTARDVQEWLRTTVGVSYTKGGVYNLLARLGWKPKVTRPQAMTTTPQIQAAWKKGGSAKHWQPVG